MSIECIKNIKEIPCYVKFAYLLIVILFVLNICTYLKISKPVQNNKSNDEIATWVDNNAEVILNSVNKYVVKQQEEMQKKQQEQATENIKKFEKELVNTKYAGVLNPQGQKVIVEFFDYNCGYCKVAAKNVKTLLEKRKDIKVILRSIAILGESSNYATKVGTAILISEPSKYTAYYEALMLDNGSARSKEGVEKAVEKAGLKMSKIEKALEKHKDEIKNVMDADMNLAGQIGINGTPAFIVNGKLIPGAVDANTLDNMLK